MFPFSIFDADGGLEWQWLERLGWLILTAILLAAAHRRATAKLRENTRRTAALEAREERYRAVVEQSDDGIAVIEIETLRDSRLQSGFLSFDRL